MFGNRCNKVIDPLTVQIYKNTAKTSRKKTHQQTFGMSALSDTKSAVLQLSFPWTFSTAEFVFYTELWRHVWSPNSNLTLQSIYSDRGPEMCFRGSRFETKASHWLKLRMDFAKRSSYLIYIRKCPYMVFGSRRKSNWWTSGVSDAVCCVFLAGMCLIWKCPEKALARSGFSGFSAFLWHQTLGVSLSECVHSCGPNKHIFTLNHAETMKNKGWVWFISHQIMQKTCE